MIRRQADLALPAGGPDHDRPAARGERRPGHRSAVGLCSGRAARVTRPIRLRAHRPRLDSAHGRLAVPDVIHGWLLTPDKLSRGGLMTRLWTATCPRKIVHRWSLRMVSKPWPVLILASTEMHHEVDVFREDDLIG